MPSASDKHPILILSINSAVWETRRKVPQFPYIPVKNVDPQQQPDLIFSRSAIPLVL